MPYVNSRLAAGKLRHRIQIVAPYGPGQDASGYVSLTAMSPVITTWASIEAISGRDTLAAQQFGSDVTHKITIRYRGTDQAVPVAITAACQIYFKSRTFQTIAVLNPDERTKTLILLAREINDSVQQVTNQPEDLS